MEKGASHFGGAALEWQTGLPPARPKCGRRPMEN